MNTRMVQCEQVLFLLQVDPTLDIVIEIEIEIEIEVEIEVEVGLPLTTAGSVLDVQSRQKEAVM